MSDYKCQKCNQIFSSNQVLKRHLNKKIDCDPTLRQVSCKYCNKLFLNRYSVYKHYNVCTEYNKSATNKDEPINLLIQTVTSMTEVNKNNEEKINNLIKTVEELKAQSTTNTSTIIHKIPKYNKKITIIINNYINAPNFNLENLLDGVNIANYLRDNTIPDGMPNGIEYGIARLIYEKCIEKMTLDCRPILCVDIKRKTFIYKENNEWCVDKVRYNDKNQKELNITIKIDNIKQKLQTKLNILLHNKHLEIDKIEEDYYDKTKNKIPTTLNEVVAEKKHKLCITKLNKRRDEIMNAYHKVTRSDFSYLTILKLSPYILFNKYDIDDDDEESDEEYNDNDDDNAIMSFGIKIGPPPQNIVLTSNS